MTQHLPITPPEDVAKLTRAELEDRFMRLEIDKENWKYLALENNKKLRELSGAATAERQHAHVIRLYLPDPLSQATVERRLFTAPDLRPNEPLLSLDAKSGS